MKLTLGVRMDFNRRSISKTHSGLNRQADRWVSATLCWLESALTIRLDFGGVWELRADSQGGTTIVRGQLGSNEVTHSFEPTEPLALSA